MSISIEVTGLNEAEEYFKNASDRLVPCISAKLSEVMQEIAAYAKSIAPVKTGEFANSIHVEQTGDLQFSLVADAPHAAVVEFGSGPHIIVPRNARTLHFEIEGEEVFATYVLHPGTAPHMTIHTAKKDNLDKIVQAIREGVREALKNE